MANNIGQVVDMAKRRGIRGYHACSQVESYWESLRKDGSVPSRSEIDPRGIEDALSNAFILETIGAGHARIRIAGSHLCDLLGMEVRGMPFSAFFTPDTREGFARAINSVTRGPSVVRLSLHAETGFQQPELSAQLVMLPLVSDLGDVSRVLGCLESRGKIGNTPRRFSLEAAEIRRLEGVHLENTQTEYRSPPQDSRPVTGLAEAEASFVRGPRSSVEPKARPAYLRLVDPYT